MTKVRKEETKKAELQISFYPKADLAETKQLGIRSSSDSRERSKQLCFVDAEYVIYEVIFGAVRMSITGEIIAQTARASYALGRRLTGQNVQRCEGEEIIFWINIPSSADLDETERVHLRHCEEGKNEAVSVSRDAALIYKELRGGVITKKILERVAQESYALGRELALAEQRD